MSARIDGFSKLTKEEKINWLATNFFTDQTEIISTLKKYNF